MPLYHPLSRVQARNLWADSLTPHASHTGARIEVSAMFRSRRFPVGVHTGLVVMESAHEIITSSDESSSPSHHQSRAHHR